MNLWTTTLKYLMFSMGAKPNGSEKSFNVDTAFIRTLALVIFSLIGAAFAAGGLAPKAQSISPRIASLEIGLSETKRDVLEFKQISQTQNAVIISRLETLSAQLSDVQRAMYERRR